MTPNRKHLLHMTDSLPLDAALDPVDRLRAILTLTPTEQPGVFEAPSEWMVGGRIFGGQILGQSVAAAINSVDPDRVPSSLHTMFLQAGDITEPVRYRVKLLHTGRSFSQLQVTATQSARTLAQSLVCFEIRSSGVDHQEVPPRLGSPQEVPSDSEALAASTLPGAAESAAAVRYRSFETRHRPNSVYLQAQGGPGTDRQLVWMRTKAAFAGSQSLQRAALAYASDYTILEPGMRRHGIAWAHPGLTRASLDHAIWFHRDVHVDAWCAYVQRAPSAQEGRSLSTGSLYSEDGILLATCAQEGVLRIPETR